MIQNQTTLHRSTIIQGNQCFNSCLGALDLSSYSGIFIVSQDVIWSFYGQQLLAALGNGYGEVKHLQLPDGEAIKSIASFEMVHQWLANSRADRKSLLMVLGGGVVGDLCGFVAATYMRGIDWVYFPTTLLAQQDASVGGKVAVNLPQGKNLVGRFWDPRAVIIDISVLKTLPIRQSNSGYMELLKHGMLSGDELLQDILSIPEMPADWLAYGEILWRGLAVKIDVVREDPYENNQRRLLNLGHTFGHALESAFAYEGLLHGEAVGVGLLFSVALARHLDPSSFWPSLESAILPRLPQLDLPKWDREQLLDLTRMDKKGIAGDVSWIVPNRPGNVSIRNGIDLDTLRKAYEDTLNLLSR